MFVNEYQNGQIPSHKTLNCKLRIMNVVTIAIDLAAIVYLIIIITEFYNVYHSTSAAAMDD